MDSSTNTSKVWPGEAACAISLCFDDGFPTQLQLAAPLLSERGLRGSFYPQSSKLELAKPEFRERAVARWKALAAAGHEIGNHTRTHPCSTNFDWVADHTVPIEDMSLADIEAEIRAGQEKLEGELGVRPTTFAYPCGMTFVGRGERRQSYVPLVARMFVVGRGFNFECAAAPLRCDLACVPAMSMDEKPAAALQALVESARRAGTWLILVGHHLGKTGAPYMTDLGAFQTLLDGLAACKDSVWVDTVHNVGSYLAKRQAARS
jgi:peptidoglycan/xylan/chitin deacetylase (PgdA/CDA1 family)